MDPLTVAREVVLERVPEATWAILTGSVVGPHRTAGSDPDIVVLRPDAPAYRESFRFRGRPVELFVQTPEKLSLFLERELAARGCSPPARHR